MLNWKLVELLGILAVVHCVVCRHMSHCPHRIGGSDSSESSDSSLVRQQQQCRRQTRHILSCRSTYPSIDRAMNKTMENCDCCVMFLRRVIEPGWGIGRSELNIGVCTYCKFQQTISSK